MRPLPAGLRRRVRRISWLFELVRARRGRAQEREYVQLREQYYRRAPSVFAEPGWRARSLELLRRRHPCPLRRKPDLKEVRVLAAAADDRGGPRMLGDLARSVDLELCDLRPYRTVDNQETSERSAARIHKWRPRLQRDLLAAFRAAHQRKPIDAVFVYGSNFDFAPETLRAMSEAGVPVVALWLDDKHTFLPKPFPWPNGQKPLIGAVDVHLSNSPEALRWYMAEGVAAYFMPQGVDPEIFRPLDVPKTVDVCFIGQRYGARARLVAALKDAGVNVECYGSGWGTRVLSDAEMVEMYSRARVNLGIGGTGVSERMICIKGRDFEVPAAGGLYLTTYNAELAFVYAIGEEILCYLNEIDCVETVRYYLERPGDAAKIAAAGRARCLRDHTWSVRLRRLFEWMEILRAEEGVPPAEREARSCS